MASTAVWRKWRRRMRVKKVDPCASEFTAQSKKYGFSLVLQERANALEDKSLDSEQSRVYVLLGERYLYVGITSKLRERLTKPDHQGKPYDRVLWLDCHEPGFGPVEVSMLEKGMYRLLKRSASEVNDAIDIVEDSETLNVGNGSKPSIPAQASTAIKYKSDKWLLDTAEGFFSILIARGYALSFDSKEFLAAMNDKALTDGLEADIPNMFDARRQAENLYVSWKRMVGRCVFLGILCIAFPLLFLAVS